MIEREKGWGSCQLEALKCQDVLPSKNRHSRTIPFVARPVGVQPTTSWALSKCWKLRTPCSSPAFVGLIQSNSDKVSRSATRAWIKEDP